MAREDDVALEIRKQADKILDDAADYLLAQSQLNIKANGSINTGFMARSGYVKRKPGRKEVGYSAPYAAFVEFGTDPHMPPIEPLKRYLMKKEGLGEKEATSRAWAMAKAIEREGTMPHPFLRPAIEETVRRYRSVRVKA